MDLLIVIAMVTFSLMVIIILLGFFFYYTFKKIKGQVKDLETSGIDSKQDNVQNVWDPDIELVKQLKKWNEYEASLKEHRKNIEGKMKTLEEDKDLPEEEHEEQIKKILEQLESLKRSEAEVKKAKMEILSIRERFDDEGRIKQ
jgi:hypothetical protein